MTPPRLPRALAEEIGPRAWLALRRENMPGFGLIVIITNARLAQR
jgi:hypothetical protein